MGWLNDTETSTDTKVVEDNWLKIPSPTTIGKTTEVRVRILDEEAIGTWRHWLGRRPYNCPGFDICPVCKARKQASKDDPDNYKNEFKLDYRYFLNVLYYDPEGNAVKIWSLTSTVGRKLKVFEEKYGDMRNYDISIRKRKTGEMDQNIEYDVIYEKESALSTENQAIAENRFDRQPFIVPAEYEALKQVAQGIEPQYNGGLLKAAEPEQPKSKTNKASKSDMITLKALVEAKGFELGDFGIVEATPPPKDVIQKLIEELAKEKS